MRKYWILFIVVALAALLFACDIGGKSGGGNPPVVNNGALALDVRGASVVADPANPPASIDVKLFKEGVQVKEFVLSNTDADTTNDFTIDGTSVKFTCPGVAPGDYTVKVDMSWAEDNQGAEPSCSGELAGTVTIVSEETASTVVDVSPNPPHIIRLAYPANNSQWQPPGAGDPTYSTPSATGDYQPQWFVFNIPTNNNNKDQLKVSVENVPTSAGAIKFALFQVGGTPTVESVPLNTIDGETRSITITNPTDGDWYVCVYGPTGAVGKYSIRFIYVPDTTVLIP